MNSVRERKKPRMIPRFFQGIARTKLPLTKKGKTQVRIIQGGKLIVWFWWSY